VSQVRRYEGGGAQPTLDVVRRLAIALSVSADELVFGDIERGPGDEMRLHLEAVQHLDPDEQAVVRTVIESVLLRHEAKRFAQASQGGPRHLPAAFARPRALAEGLTAALAKVASRPAEPSRLLARCLLRD